MIERLRPALLAAGIALAAVGLSHGERLPLSVYTTAEGLPRDRVHRIARDRAGYLWFLTSEGAARFDGERMRSFGPAEGFPASAVHDLLEARDGALWVSTEHGLYRIDTARAAATRAERIDERPVTALHEAPDGTLWAATAGGLASVTRAGAAWQVRLERFGQDAVVRRIAGSAAGELWVATTHGLFLRGTSGHWSRVAPQLEEIKAVTLDGAGHPWLATATELWMQPPGAVDLVRVTGDAAQSIGPLTDLLVTTGRTLWVVGVRGIARIGDLGAAAPAMRTFGTAAGWPESITLCLAEDSAGNVWAGTESGGAVRIARGGFTSFDRGDGLPAVRVSAILENPQGDLLTVLGGQEHRTLARFDGRRFEALGLRLPAGCTSSGWGTHQVLLVDRRGDWWAATACGVARWRGPARAADLAARPPDALYTTRDGLPGNDVFRIYEDHAGAIWVGTITLGQPTLSRIDPARGAVRAFTSADGAPPSAPSAFAEDRAGALWIGFYDGGIARVDGGRLRHFAPAAGGPEGFVWTIYRGHDGRLWIGSSEDGLLRIDDERADPPRVARWSTANGLSANSVHGIVEDAAGLIYAATPRGVDRLDPATGRIVHFTTRDGLANSELLLAYRDRHDTLWFGTLGGLSRLEPASVAAAPPPVVRIEGVRMGGVAREIDPRGAYEVSGFDVPADARQVDLEFGGLYLGGGGPLRFEYLVEGAGRDWSEPSAERALHFAGLAPGRYRVFVRAAGAAGARPAVVAFRVERPLWQRWYSIALAAALVAAALAAAHRQRTKRLLELERVRTRIATDLHDDIGATLSEIAIAAEVVRQAAVPRESPHAALLDNIAQHAREMVDSLGDIVWSIDPQRDRVGDLAGRVRRFGGDLLGARGVGFTFVVPHEFDEVMLDANLRRELLLVFKEALNNAARHARAREVRAELRITAHDIALTVADDGCGFDPAAARAGQGLASLHRRAAAAGGTCTIDSGQGHGTRVEVRVSRRTRGR